MQSNTYTSHVASGIEAKLPGRTDLTLIVLVRTTAGAARERPLELFGGNVSLLFSPALSESG